MYGCFMLDYRMIGSEDTPWIAESGGDPDSGGCSYCRSTPAQTSYPAINYYSSILYEHTGLLYTISRPWVRFILILII